MKRRQFLKGSAITGAAIAAPLLAQSGSGLLASSSTRKVYRIIRADRSMVGTLPILRAFAGDQQDYVSPFVLLDEFGPVKVEAGSDPLRVDAHPHAGVIPTTYFLSGSGHHKDSLNYDFQISTGDFMLFSSGRGAIHMEESGQQLYDHGGHFHGFQIWLNMPAAYKLIAPSTEVYQDKQMGKVKGKGFEARVVLGELFGTRSEVELLSPAFYYHIRLEPNTRLDLPTDAGHNAFAYAVNGSVELEGRQLLEQHHIALFERGESTISLFSQNGAELLVLGGQPLNERVYAYGPFVMNTEQQIRQCIADYQAGKMGNPDAVNARTPKPNPGVQGPVKRG